LGAGQLAPNSLIGDLQMKIKVLRSTKIAGQTYAAGDVADVENHIGFEMIAMGKCEAHEDAAPVVEDRSVGLTTKSAKSLLKRGSKKAK